MHTDTPHRTAPLRSDMANGGVGVGVGVGVHCAIIKGNSMSCEYYTLTMRFAADAAVIAEFVGAAVDAGAVVVAVAVVAFVVLHYSYLSNYSSM